MYIEDKIKELVEQTSKYKFLDGWRKCKKGQFLEGMTIITSVDGTSSETWAERLIRYSRFDKPLWNKKNKGRVILNLGGGLGDQIFNVRWARELAKLDNEVFVTCNHGLLSVFRNMEWVSGAFHNEDGLKVPIKYDYWVPDELAPIQLEHDYKDIDGSPYIFAPERNTGKIGLRWRGNPWQPMDWARSFPAHQMFGAVAGHNCISLQRDHGIELRPDWVEYVPLNNFDDTIKAISSCKLVISVDTCIAHLAGAMGIPTWVPTPHSIIYWMHPDTNGHSVFYDSMTLFRNRPEFIYDETIKDWKILRETSWQPIFKDIQQRLRE